MVEADPADARLQRCRRDRPRPLGLGEQLKPALRRRNVGVDNLRKPRLTGAVVGVDRRSSPQPVQLAGYVLPKGRAFRSCGEGGLPACAAFKPRHNERLRAGQHHRRRQHASLPRQRHGPGFSLEACGDPVPFAPAAEHQRGAALHLLHRPVQIERAIPQWSSHPHRQIALRAPVLDRTGILKRLGRLGVQG